MLKRIFIRNIRQPLASMAVILFAAVLTVVLCHLHIAQAEEQRSYEEAYASVPVFFKITALDGSRVSSSADIKGWITDLFTESGLKPNLAPYVKELHMRVSYYNVIQKYPGYDPVRGPMTMTRQLTFTGISSTRVAEELTAGWGGSIHWHDGYDESILQSDEFVCIVPEELKDTTQMDVEFEYSAYLHGPDGFAETKWIPCTFKVVGYYTDPGNSRIYIPYPTMDWFYAKMGYSKELEGLGAILEDNNDLDTLRETAAYWFAEPNPMGDPTPWGRYGYDYYFYALDIDDAMLTALSTEMKNSMRMNQIASTIVFVLSAGAGFLTGFLVIRARKREIALMRTVGASQPAIYLELAMEQLICVAAGILIGGGYALWQPAGQLCLFGGIYFAGLTAALIVFLRKNLLTTIKEEE